MSGSGGTQTIDGQFKFCDLTVNNPNGVDFETGSEVEICGALTLTEGDFCTTNATSVTLISNSSGTAMVDGSGTGNVCGDITQERYIDGCAGYLSLGAPIDMTFADFNTVYFQGFTGSADETAWENTQLYDETILGISDSGYFSPSNITDAISSCLLYTSPSPRD